MTSTTHAMLDRFIREAATALDLDPSSVPRTEEGFSDLLARLASERDEALYDWQKVVASAPDDQLLHHVESLADYGRGHSFGYDLDTPSAAAIRKECDDLREMLLAKNAAYGDSALSPLRIFSKASPVEQLLVRIDDKLSRLARGSAAGEDVVLDLLGYLILLRVARTNEREQITRAPLPGEVAP